MESHVQTLEQLMEASGDHSLHAGAFLRIEEDEQEYSKSVDLDEEVVHKLSQQTHRIIELEERLFYQRTYSATLTKQLQSIANPQSPRSHQHTPQSEELKFALQLEREENAQLHDKLAQLQQRNASLEQKEKDSEKNIIQHQVKQAQWEQRKIQLEKQNRKLHQLQARVVERERDMLQLKKKYTNVVRINRVLQQQLTQSDRKFLELECFMEIALADKCRHTMRMLHEQKQKENRRENKQENKRESQKQNQSVPNSQDSVALKPARQLETICSLFKEEYLQREKQRQQRLEQLRKGSHTSKDQRNKKQYRAQSHEPHRKFT